MPPGRLDEQSATWGRGDPPEKAERPGAHLRLGPDEPRLAYAEWAQKHDKVRAEFIFLQMRLTHSRRMQIRIDDSGELWEREQKLIRRYKRRWGKPVRGLVSDCDFYRGFVEEVTMDAREFPVRAEEVYRRAPIRHLSLTGAAPAFSALCASPHLARIVTLSLLENGLGDEHVQQLVESPYLSRWHGWTWVGTRSACQVWRPCARQGVSPMRGIAEDETRHGALAWQVAAWAERRLGAAARRRVRAARRQAVEALRAALTVEPEGELTRLAGLPGAEDGLRICDGLERALWRRRLA